MTPACLRSLVLAAVLLAACSTGNVHYDPSRPHHTPTGFRNPGDADKPGFAALLRWKWQRLLQPEVAQDASRVPRRALDPAHLSQPEAGWRATWIGHSTVLLQIDDVNILTDPTFSDKASPIAWLGADRATPPALRAEDLPFIDVVLISHNHYDHLDEASVQALARQPGGPPRFIVPLGVERWFAGQGIANVEALDWWQQTAFRKGASEVRIDFLPAQHWSRRTLFDTNATLWGGFAIRAAGRSAYFAGDTGYGSVFREIGERAGPFDLALIPVGCFEPRWFMRNHHVDPAQAVRIHRDVRARYSMGIHWGAFRLCDEPVEAPLDLLPAALAAEGVPPPDFELWAVGERRHIPPPAR